MRAYVRMYVRFDGGDVNKARHSNATTNRIKYLLAKHPCAQAAQQQTHGPTPHTFELFYITGRERETPFCDSRRPARTARLPQVFKY